MQLERLAMREFTQGVVMAVILACIAGSITGCSLFGYAVRRAIDGGDAYVVD
jgi:hypothetical protein